MILIPSSIGELIDKLSILHVKQLKICNKEKLQHVNKEFELLHSLSFPYLNNQEISYLYLQLIEINKKLWDIEDKLRVMESEHKFDSEFIDLARKVYFTNDERFRLKNEINLITSSEIREIKDYKQY